MLHLTLAQTSSGDSYWVALVRRLVRGGIGVPALSFGTALLLLIACLILLAAFTYVAQIDRRRWLRGLVDVRAHFDQLGAGLEILRRNKRPLWVLFAGAVISWSGWSFRTWQIPGGKAEFEATLARYDNSASRFALAHSWATASLPLRSIGGLADYLPLAMGACMLLFARTGQLSKALRFNARAIEGVRLKRRIGSIWLGLLMLVAYRSIVFALVPDAAPAADCMYLNAIVLPWLLLAGDAMLLGWVAVEFSRSINGHFEWQPSDWVALVRSIPAAGITCFLLNPGRYFLLFCVLFEGQFSTSNWPVARWHTVLLFYTCAQSFGVIWLALPAVLVVDRRGSWAGLFRSYLSLVRRSGGQLVGLTVVGIFLTAAVLFPFYWVFGAMQAETWSFLGAASYGHYVTLLMGLVILAAFTDLAYRELGMVEPELPVPVSVLMPAESSAGWSGAGVEGVDVGGVPPGASV